MRINKYIASCTELSRRAADQAIDDRRVWLNGQIAIPGVQVEANDLVTLDNKSLQLPVTPKTVLLNKPVGYVCSRNGQGSRIIYDLLPAELQALKPVGRLDKDSSGLLLLTSDGELAQQLTHPSHQKQKVYTAILNKSLGTTDRQAIEKGIRLEDGVSKLALQGSGQRWTLTMHEGRNRQIRRTFAATGYRVVTLHRIQFGPYKLDPGLTTGSFRVL